MSAGVFRRAKGSRRLRIMAEHLCRRLSGEARRLAAMVRALPVLVLVLVFRPGGLLGSGEAEKV